MAPPAPPPPKRLPTQLETTRVLLAECGLNSNQIATYTGLSYFWIRKVRSGEISNPGSERVERLFNFLAELKDVEKHA